MVEKNDVNEAVVDFCMDVIKEPLIHFSETDLHLLLAEKLFDRIVSLKDINEDTNLDLGYVNPSRKYKTRLLHREYGSGRKTRIDLIIFNENDIEKINNANLTKKTKKDYLPPLFAFELGTEKIGLDLKKIGKHISSDIKKLENCKDTGYIIHIIRDTNKIKRQDKMEKIEKFKKTIYDRYRNHHNNKRIKIIAVILHLFRKNHEDTRCEILCKNSTKKYHFEQFKEEDIQDSKKIKRTLKYHLNSKHNKK